MLTGSTSKIHLYASNKIGFLFAFKSFFWCEMIFIFYIAKSFQQFPMLFLLLVLSLETYPFQKISISSSFLYDLKAYLHMQVITQLTVPRPLVK